MLEYALGSPPVMWACAMGMTQKHQAEAPEAHLTIFRCGLWGRAAERFPQCLHCGLEIVGLTRVMGDTAPSVWVHVSEPPACRSRHHLRSAGTSVDITILHKSLYHPPLRCVSGILHAISRITGGPQPGVSGRAPRTCRQRTPESHRRKFPPVKRQTDSVITVIHGWCVWDLDILPQCTDCLYI